jgi:two-component system sensor histidine kinase ResE
MPFVVFCAAIIMGGFIARSLSRPLHRLSLAALHMARGDYATRITEKRDDELGQLGQSFNLMAVSLETSIRTLKDERDRIRNLIHALTEGVIATDSELRILLLNPAAAEYLGLDLQGSIGRSVVSLPLPKMLKEQLTNSALIPQSSIVTVSEQLALGVTTSPLSDPYGNLSAQIAILKDITESYRLEEQRREFVANVSHELRTPLTSIRGFVEGMLDHTIPEQQNERYLNIIHQESIRLTKMIHELLDLSHIESGRLQLHPEVVELRPLLQGIWLRTRVAAGREDISLELTLSPAEPVILADPDRIEQIFINLLSNAMRYTPEGGTITIASLPLTENGLDKLVIEITDSGAGIDPENLPYIWDRFFKADRSRSSGGTGLGLSIVRSLVEAHQETIWAENRPPLGACFAFTMKRAVI